MSQNAHVSPTQDYAELMARIKAEGERYNSSLKSLGNKLDDIALALADILPESITRFEAGRIGWARDYAFSNIGSYGPAFYVIDHYKYSGGHAVVSTTAEPGMAYYLHRDLRTPIFAASAKDRRYAAQNLDRFFNALASWLKERADANEKAKTIVDSVAKMLASLKER